ncbi:MAG TPA: acyltransferase [Candidatus Saccharimonadales bacterium]|nr:acyltransferase [Candidatus Saccharimonadales bacterium]
MLVGVKSFWSRWRERTSSNVKSTDSGKLSYLESVRGIAACAVVFAHLLVTYYPGAGKGLSSTPHIGENTFAELFYGLPAGFMASGSFAVIIFFTLSGFVLTYKYFQDRKVKDLHRQAAKRYFRLAIPIFFIVIAAYLLLANGAMASVHTVAQMTGSSEAGRIFGFNPTLPQAFYDATIGVLVDKNTAFNPVLWTMSVELMGSFVIFGLAALLGNLNKRWVVYIGIIIALSHSYYVCFVLGMILADIVHTTKLIDHVRNKVSKFYVYGLLIIIAVLASFPEPISIDVSGTFYEHLLIPGVSSYFVFQQWQFFSAFVLLAIILVRPELQRLLNHRVLVFVGGISFAIYLTHYLILHSLGDWLYVLMRNSAHGPNSAALVAAAATVAVTVLISIFWKKYIDDMSVSVSRRVADILLK